jgi:capsular exopolysaccharide synthesis family protein
MGLNFLGVVPPIKPKDDRLGSRDLVVHLEPKSVVSESCRTIRSNLLFLNPDTPWRSIVVTSAGPDDGKTTTMVNLASALAQGGARVLVVDSDMRRSRLHKTFGVPNDIGLSGLIAKGGDLDEAIKRTEVPGLFVLPAGAVPPNPAELLHSDRFKKLVGELAGRFDRVIYDSPPVTAVADPLVLAHILDGTLIVARAFSTDRDVLERAVKSLRDANARLLGVVLNALDSNRYRYRYKTGYYYRYGDYSYGKDDAAA